MQALVKTRPGHGHVEIRDVPIREPGPRELLIRVKYCGICGTDLHIEADEFPNDPPVIMGHEYCGTVIAVGENVRDAWSVGDRVVGEVNTESCGECAFCRAGQTHICAAKRPLGSRHDGAFAEYLTLPAGLAHLVPEGVPWEVAGITEPLAITAHALLERGGLGRTGRALPAAVLITGAATIGLLATVWARRMGVPEIVVAGTDLDDPLRLDLARQMGATHVLNVQREDLGRAVMERTGGQGVEMWVECSGAGAAIASGLELVRKTGRVVLIGLTGPQTIPVPWNTLLLREINLAGCFSSPPSSWKQALAAEAQEAPHLRQLVTHILPLEEWTRGFAMLRTGEAVKILIDMDPQRGSAAGAT
jgi:L-iditol 2-dehydrogenase